MRSNSTRRAGAVSRRGFVVIGEGRPARALLDVLAQSSGAAIDALVLKDPDTNPLAEFAREHGVLVVDVRHFAEDARQIARAPGAWLINVNSTMIIPAD